MMLATIGGPLIRGFITTSLSWRWIFYINIPVGGAALVYLITALHLPPKRVNHRVDYLGGGLLALAATALSCWPPGRQPSTAGARARSSASACCAVAAAAAFIMVEPGWWSRSFRCTCPGTGTSSSSWC